MLLGLCFIVSSFFHAFPDADVIKHYDKNQIGAGSSWLSGAVQLIAAMVLMIPRIQIGAAIVVGVAMLFYFVFGPDNGSNIWRTLGPFAVFVICTVCAVWLWNARDAELKR